MATAVRVIDVSKTFRLYHERASTVKERIVNRRKAEYEQFWALRNVSLEIGDGETAGLIGPNGSGKTTLLKLVAGIMRPTEGRIETRGRVASLLELGAGFHPDLTGRQNVYLNASILGLSKRETDRHFDEIVAFAELEKFIDMQVRHYSSGMYVRLGFAVAVHVDPEILIVDEVLSVGDEAFQRKCLDKIRLFQSEGRTIVFVTHALDTVPNICSRAFLLREGRLEAAGDPLDVIVTYRLREQASPEPESVQSETEEGRRVRILRVRVTDGQGKDRTTFHTGEDVHVVVDAEAEEPIDDAVVGVAIYAKPGEMLLGTNTEIAGKPLGKLHGKVRVNFVCKSIPMQRGNFLVSVGVTSRDYSISYDWHAYTYGFTCEETSSVQGSIVIPVDVSVERL